MPVDGIVFPVLQLILDEFHGALGLQAQGIATQVNGRPPVFIAWKIELLAKRRQRVLVIK